jgi:hypothetical protein
MGGGGEFMLAVALCFFSFLLFIPVYSTFIFIPELFFPLPFLQKGFFFLPLKIEQKKQQNVDHTIGWASAVGFIKIVYVCVRLHQVEKTPLETRLSRIFDAISRRSIFFLFFSPFYDPVYYMGSYQLGDWHNVK